LFDLGRQTAKGFAEPVEAFAVEGGEIREVDPSKPPLFLGGK